MDLESHQSVLKYVQLQKLEIQILPAGVNGGDKVEEDAKERGTGENRTQHTSIAHHKVKPVTSRVSHMSHMPHMSHEAHERTGPNILP